MFQNMSYCLLATLNLLVLISLSSCKLLELDIMWKKSPFQTMLESGMHPKLIEKTLTTYKNTSVPLFRYKDNEYYGQVLIGHPGQKFNVIFDTAWANSWVPSAKCDVLDMFCKNHKKYDSSHSSTFKRDGRKIKVPYGNDTFEGILSMDLFHLGQKNVTNQTFAEMTHIPTDFNSTKADGVLGLAFSSVAYLNVTPFLDNMVLQKSIDKKVFSFYFNRDKASKKGGTLFLGGSQSKHYVGNFTYVNLIATDYWRFEVTSIHVKGETSDMCGGKACPTIIDTSSTIITGPANATNYINELIGARHFVLRKYMVDCAKIGHLPAITFTIGSRNFILKSRDYIQKVDDHGVMTCFSIFQANELPPDFENYWTLGAAFMARFYVEFDADNERVGFADVRM